MDQATTSKKSVAKVYLDAVDASKSSAKVHTKAPTAAPATVVGAGLSPTPTPAPAPEIVQAELVGSGTERCIMMFSTLNSDQLTVRSKTPTIGLI